MNEIYTNYERTMGIADGEKEIIIQLRPEIVKKLTGKIEKALDKIVKDLKTDIPTSNDTYFREETLINLAQHIVDQLYNLKH